MNKPEKMEQSGKRRIQLGIILACAAAGMLLLLFGGRGAEADGSAAPTLSWQSYTAELEAKATALCGRVEGVGDVAVAVSLTQGVEYVYEENRLLTERPPQIGGIGVVCSGGNDPVTVQTLISLLSAAFGVSSNRIYVTGAE
ncbi:MAG: hypothetical protein IKD37_01900 [Clostridia bacterium]|nr:hypothetical protein [Clostridia bacterium]